MPRDTYVYAARFGPYLKVGVSEDPKKRITQFHSPATKMARPADIRDHKAEPVFAIAADPRFEQMLHVLLAEHQVVGEWFDATAMPWIDALLAREHNFMRHRFTVDPPPKVQPLPCDCYEDDEDCACPLSGEQHCPSVGAVPCPPERGDAAVSGAYTSDGRRLSSITHSRRGHKCQFCDFVAYGNGGEVAHGRKHVRRGEAVELFKEYAISPPMSHRMFLEPGDERIAEYLNSGFAIVSS